MRLGLAAAVAAASALGSACLEVPPYSAPIKVAYVPDGAGGALVAPLNDVALHFAGGGFHFPDQLLIGNVDVMGHATSPCWGESGTGFAVMPMPRVSGDPLSGGVSPINNDHENDLHVLMSGPAVVQLKVTWSTRWNFTSTDGSTCSTNAMHTFSGSSTFTVFPDDHIVRHDVLTEMNLNAERLLTASCTCAPLPSQAPDGFIPSSYWAFDRARFPTLFGLGDRGPDLPDPLPLGNNYDVTPPYATVCFNGPGDQYQIASVWVVPPRIPPGPETNAAAAGFDTVVSHDVQKLSNSKLDFPWDVHGALFVEHSNSNCTAALKRAIEYTTPQALMISTAGSTITKLPSDLDGIYGGDPGNGSAGIDVSDGITTLSGGPSGSFVVWLRFPRATLLPTATRTSAPVGWYVPQRITDREWLVWVQDKLQPGETITVRPN
jgi:hypothetical protein